MAWAVDAVDGTSTATYYPGGAFYQGLLSTDVIETL